MIWQRSLQAVRGLTHRTGVSFADSVTNESGPKTRRPLRNNMSRSNGTGVCPAGACSHVAYVFRKRRRESECATAQRQFRRRWGGHLRWGSLELGDYFSHLPDWYVRVAVFLPGLGDGAQPQRLVLGADGAVHGTTAEVLRSRRSPIHGKTFFRIAPSGGLTTLYVFSVLTDGYCPSDLVVGPDGYFYGVTRGGGAAGFGTAFRLDTHGR